MDKGKSISKIHVRYKTFQKDLRDIWESFCVIDFYGPRIHDAIKSETMPTLEVDRIWNATSRTLDKDDTFGAISSLTSRGNYRRTLLEAVLVFEDYMSDLITTVHSDIPEKMSSGSNDAGDSASYQKMLKLILSSKDKEEMVERLIEEKVRGIFYGNPLDVFEKDKAKLEFGTYFKEHHKETLKSFARIVAARNIVAHNNGKIDRKYQREVDPEAQLGRRITLNKEFLKESIYVLSYLAAEATGIVIGKVYGRKPGGNLGKALEGFKKNGEAP